MGFVSQRLPALQIYALVVAGQLGMVSRFMHSKADEAQADGEEQDGNHGHSGFMRLELSKVSAGVWPLDLDLLVIWGINCCMANPDLIKLATESQDFFTYLKTTDFTIRGVPN
ncbi:hypothetical protein WISP_133084 [Willisornis vidua]|uniref:Uncharacterized protein n=1 Tax=Willisornis vidua TaxID=1566151 RepID=A0ABQ9CVA0_9PASS|nr:hypothetical protein WISP_133084 [Willisornis vidua]